MKPRAKKKIKSVPKFLPPSSSIMNDPGPQPLFLVLWHRVDEPSIRILQLETPTNKRHVKVNLNEYVACFKLKELEGIRLSWLFSPPTDSTPFMYIMPDCSRVKTYAEPREKSVCKPTHGYRFNVRTGECQQVKPVTRSIPLGQAVNCGGRIFLVKEVDYYNHRPHPTLECYDPDKDEWEALNPFPIVAVNHWLEGFGHHGHLIPIGVWRDTILYKFGSHQLWAYNVTKNKWYQVQAKDGDNEIDKKNQCYTIYGWALVVENSIYALTTLSAGVILELSIERKENDDDLEYTCALSSKMCVPGIVPIGYYSESTYAWSRHLVHLGKDNFCLVQSSYSYGYLRSQPVYVTNLKLKELESGGKSMSVINRHIYEVELEHWDQFQVEICFFLPKDKTMCETEHGKLINFNFDLEAEGLKPVHASTLGDDIKGGHYIYVRNLPPEATEEKLEKELKKFGPIKRDGIWVNKNETGKCYACVEFESATSKQRAIEAATIRIGGGCAEIEEKTIASPLLNEDEGFKPVLAQASTLGGSAVSKNNKIDEGPMNRRYVFPPPHSS